MVKSAARLGQERRGDGRRGRGEGRGEGEGKGLERRGERREGEGDREAASSYMLPWAVLG